MALKERVEAAGSVVILKVTEQPGDTTAQTLFNYSMMQQAVEVLTENSLEGMVHVMAMVLNEAMQIGRSKAIGAGPYERSEGRKGYANGFKDKSVKSRLGVLPLRVPQVRGDVDFYRPPLYQVLELPEGRA